MNKMLQMFRETSLSLFSDGKISMKRVISFLTFVLVAWGFSRVIMKVIPVENQSIFMHCFDGLLALIATLLIGATWQDVAKNKVQGKTDQTKAENPITPPDQPQ